MVVGITNLNTNKQISKDVALISNSLPRPCTYAVSSLTPLFSSFPLPPITSSGFVKDHGYRNHEPEQRSTNCEWRCAHIFFSAATLHLFSFLSTLFCLLSPLPPITSSGFVQEHGYRDHESGTEMNKLKMTLRSYLVECHNRVPVHFHLLHLPILPFPFCP